VTVALRLDIVGQPHRLPTAKMAGEAPTLQFLGPYHRVRLSKRMNDEENDGDADRRIGHVERRPRMGERHMQIKEQEIDHVTVKQAVSQISEHAGK